MVKALKNIIFLGPPGSGKGTLSQQLQQIYGYQHISTGNIFREEIAKATPMGQQIAVLVVTGQYVPDALTNAIVKERILELDQAGQNFILDGFPRTVEQADFLASLELRVPFIVLNLDARQSVLLKRLGQRWFCPQCKATYNETNLRSTAHPNCQVDQEPLVQRPDDQPKAIKQRLKIYQEQTQVLIDYYKKSEHFFLINSEPNPDIILNTIQRILKHD